MSRRAQEINVIIHYPTTYYGWLDLMRRIASMVFVRVTKEVTSHDIRTVRHSRSAQTF